MWATLALERSASSRRSADALDETAGWSAAGRSRRVGGGRAVHPPMARPFGPGHPPASGPPGSWPATAGRPATAAAGKRATVQDREPRRGPRHLATSDAKPAQAESIRFAREARPDRRPCREPSRRARAHPPRRPAAVMVSTCVPSPASTRRPPRGPTGLYGVGLDERGCGRGGRASRPRARRPPSGRTGTAVETRPVVAEAGRRSRGRG